MKKRILAVLSMLMLLSFQAKAADKGSVELKSVSEVDVTVTNDKGEKEVKRVEAAKANVTPGDTVIFTNYYVNKGDKSASDVVITNPVPEHMIYLDGSAEGKGTRIEFSIDKGKSFVPAGKLTVRNKEGREKPASAADYTHIRWTVEKPIEKGGKGSVSFKAKVE